MGDDSVQAQSQAIEQAHLALVYHKEQVKTANFALILFLVVLVGFTLYRVHIEWTLSQSIRSAEDLERSVEQMRKLEQDKVAKQATLNFILGRDSEGNALNSRRIRRNPSGATSPRIEEERLAQLPSSSRTLRELRERQAAANVSELHNLYTPFFKECTFNENESRLSVTPQSPLEFIAKAQAELGLRLLADRSTDPLRIFCVNDPFSTRSTISSGAEEQLRALAAATARANRSASSISSQKTPPDELCRASQAVASQMSSVSAEAWFPGMGRESSQYLDAGRCRLNSTFQDDFSQAERLLAQLNSSLLVKAADLELPLREGEARQLRELLDYSQLQQSLRTAAERQSEVEAAKVKSIQAEIQKIVDSIQSLKGLRPARQEDKSSADSFSLYQLLLGALFVFSALTAALTAAFVSRAHSFEIIEIERFLRTPDEHRTKPINPFSKVSGSREEATSLRDLLGLYRADPKATTAATKAGAESSKPPASSTS